ncbi:MAG: hypothetical protein AAGA65_17925 [Actinomycetota bacterium]
MADVASQLPDKGRAEEFTRVDLLAALDLLSQVEDWHADTVADGPGRRLTRDGTTVAGYHILVALDPIDPRPEALLVYQVDIWPETWPDDQEPLR